MRHVSNSVENSTTNKDFRKLLLNREFALTREITHGHKLSALAKLLEFEVLISDKSFVTFDADFEQLG